jgi:hypothetical protein
VSCARCRYGQRRQKSIVAYRRQLSGQSSRSPSIQVSSRQGQEQRQISVLILHIAYCFHGFLCSRSRSPRDRKEGERRPDEDEKRRRPNEPPSRPLGRREKEKEELDLGEIVRMADKVRYFNLLYCFIHFHLFQDEAEKKLEIEMQKRRERIEKWRTERPKPNQAAAALKEEPEVDDDLLHKKGVCPSVSTYSRSYLTVCFQWTLEDEDDDDLDDSTAGTTDIDDNNTKPIVKEEVEDDVPPKPSSSPLNDLADMETTKR